jgi:uncharacterized protein (TIGR03437 family)
MMRKMVYLLAAAAALNGQSLEIADSSTGPMSSAILGVRAQTGGADIAALQFDIEYPNQWMTLSVLPGSSARNASKQIYLNDLAAAKKRVLVTGMNSAALGDGPVLLLHVSAASPVPPGEYRFRLSGVVGVDRGANVVPLDAKDGVLRIDTSLQNFPLTGEGVLNSASLLPGPVASGEMVTLLGAHLAEPDSVVTFDGLPAPVLFSSGNQINTLTPALLSGSETRIEVLRQEAMIAQITVPVASAAPGIFTEDASGAGPAVVVLENGSRASALDPARAGSVITIYATGLGADAAITARVGQRDAELIGAEALTGFPGIIQIRIQLPRGISGFALPLSIAAAGLPSQAGVTVAIAP